MVDIRAEVQRIQDRLRTDPPAYSIPRNSPSSGDSAGTYMAIVDQRHPGAWHGTSAMGANHVSSMYKQHGDV